MEINNSFFEKQRKIMNNINNKILIYKKFKFKEKEKNNIEINKKSKYMNSWLFFIYRKGFSDFFLNKIQKLNPSNFPKVKKSLILIWFVQ